MTIRPFSLRVAGGCAAAAGILLIGTSVAQNTAVSWPFAGHDLANTRSQPAETLVGPSNVGTLIERWVFTTGGDVSATPTVDNSAAYFPDWAGNLYAVKSANGNLLWSRKISDYNNQVGSISRVSPAIHNDTLILGDNVSSAIPHDGAHIMAVDKGTGALRWITQVDSHLAAIITGSPVVSGNTVVVGVSSNEEALATNNAYPCCTFRGSMVALDATTGAILWKTFTSPANNGVTGGYSGNAIWQPAAVDPGRGLVYAGTGNNYTVPDAVLKCEQKAQASGNFSATCTAADDYFETAMAFDLHSGAIRWANRLSSFDAWTVACTTGGTNCPSPAGPDFDLSGSGPNLIGNLVGWGQKSGIYWALDAATGRIVWATPVGPGSTLGGIEWGSATDGSRIYVAITNANHVQYTLQPSGQTINYGSWSALDSATGKILWQTPDPTGNLDMGAVSVANGVVYAGSMSGFMYALDAGTGATLFHFASGGSVLDGPSIVNGTVYWGSGYSHIASVGTGNNKVFAFKLP